MSKLLHLNNILSKLFMSFIKDHLLTLPSLPFWKEFYYESLESLKFKPIFHLSFRENDKIHCQLEWLNADNIENFIEPFNPWVKVATHGKPNIICRVVEMMLWPAVKGSVQSISQCSSICSKSFISYPWYEMETENASHFDDGKPSEIGKY